MYKVGWNYIRHLYQGMSFSQLKLQPKLKADGTPRKQIMSPFAKYVKENYSSVRRQSPQTDHGQVMSKLAVMYKQNCTV